MPPDKAGLEAAATARNFRFRRPLLLWLFPAFSFALALLLGRAWAIYSPDARYYRMLALGRRALVPAPFSARILAPAAAQWLGTITSLGVDNGFLALGILSLAAILCSMMYLLRFQNVPAGVLAAIFLMPFWLVLFHDYYLPDLLHASILAALLVCLVSGRVTLAMLLLFPAYLTRESTLLAALCLAWAGWRRASIRAMFTGLLATLAGILVSRHFLRRGAVDVRGMSGGKYLLGKLTWSFLRNIFGLPLWTNSMPRNMPGCKPVWTASLPHMIHLGIIHSIGFCPPSVWGPGRVLLAWFGVFGIGPALAAVSIGAITRAALSGGFWGERGSNFSETSARAAGARIAFRFCVLYGIFAFLLAPLLGASVDRLADYAWPFFFIALPWIVCRLAAAHSGIPRGRGLWLLLIHLAACWIAWFAFSRPEPARFYLYAGLIDLGLNMIAYVLLKRVENLWNFSGAYA